MGGCTTDIGGLSEQLATLRQMRADDQTAYRSMRDAVIIASLPHSSNYSKDRERAWYQRARARQGDHVETVLYGAIWEALRPNERLVIEQLYYEHPPLVAETTGLYKALHAFAEARESGDTALARQHLRHALWELLHNSPYPARNDLERDKARRRRTAQAMMLNSMSCCLKSLPTPDYIIEPLRQRYAKMPLENLLPDIVFPLEENARTIAEEIQRINAQMQQEIEKLTATEQKSIVTDAVTIPEATHAFSDLYMGIVETGTRTLIDQKLEKLAQRGLNEAEIRTALEEVLSNHQNNTIPYKTEMLAIHFHGKLNEVRMRQAGHTHYMWLSMDDDRVRSSHSANDGQIFSFDNPPPTGHPGEDYNCRCQAAPVQLAALNLPPALIAAAIAATKATIKRSQQKIKDAAAKVRKNPVVRGEKAPKGGRKDTDWSFDKNKSPKKWENQKRERDWTDEEITKAIKHGDAYRTENYRTNKPATLYEYNGKYVVRDDTTKEIIQIGCKGFEHPSLP